MKEGDRERKREGEKEKGFHLSVCYRTQYRSLKDNLSVITIFILYLLEVRNLLKNENRDFM